MKQLDILLVKPGSQKQLYGDLSKFKLTGIEPPMWAALMAASMRDKKYDVKLYDAEVEGWTYEQTAVQIHEANPRLVVVVVSGTNPSASTMNMTGAGEILSALKRRNPHVKTALTGLHPSALPERTLDEEDVDYVIVGEAIRSLPGLMMAINSNELPYGVPGIWYRDGKQIVGNPRAELIDTLDDLPMPAWELLPMEHYRAHNWHCFDNIAAREPYGVIYTSLGCPYKCSFCCINALFGKPGIRYRSPKKVIEEIDYLVNSWNIRNIKILDEMFVLKESHVVEICDLIIERGYDLNMWAYARVNTVNERMLAKMRQAGIRWVAYGFESGSATVLDDVTKGYRFEKIDSVVEMTYNAGLYIGANFMFGLPEDDLVSMQATLDLAKSINAEWANFNVTMAYPGSSLYDQAIHQGWPLPDTWQGYSQYAFDTLPLPTRYLTGSEVLEFRDAAFVEYFSRPEYLSKIETTFGRATEDYICEMVSRSLKRKYLPQPASIIM
ncbi:cobalamin-dependent protein [candidate division KSB1 bacterium]|nr:cobalamin-dependent protein [candidate division KSB1 bacterium]